MRSTVHTLRPPLEPMLARRARELPAGDWLYEPKWDGFRCLAFVDGDEVDLRSRHGARDRARSSSSRRPGPGGPSAVQRPLSG